MISVPLKMSILAVFWSFFLVLVLPILGFPSSFSANSATNLQALFGTALSPEAEIFLPSYANYTEDLQQRWTEWAAPSYIGGIKVATAEDVQNIVSSVSFVELQPRKSLSSA